MELILKLLLVFTLVLITIQDLKERKVTVLLFLASGCIMTYLHFINTSTTSFITHILFNISIVIVILLILGMYSKWVLQKSLANTFGLGDALFFIIMAMGFSIVSFLVLFSFSLLFSFAIFLVLKKKLTLKTVPLAGLQSLFLSIVFYLNPLTNLLDFYHL